MAEKLRNMTAVYIFREGKLLMLYRVGSRVVAPSWCGVGGHFEQAELNDPRAVLCGSGGKRPALRRKAWRSCVCGISRCA